MIALPLKAIEPARAMTRPLPRRPLLSGFNRGRPSGAGGARRRQTPVDEFADGLQAREARLADVVDTAVHQLEIRRARRKARVCRGVLALDFARELRQTIEQLRFLVAARGTDRFGQPR